VPNRDPKESRILPYLGSLEVLKCPLGVPEREPNMSYGKPYADYPFSYSINIRFTGYGAYGRRAGEPCNLPRVVHPSQKVMAIEEDLTRSTTAGGGRGGEYGGRGTSSVSVRHDRGREYGNYEQNLALATGRADGATLSSRTVTVSCSTAGTCSPRCTRIPTTTARCRCRPCGDLVTLHLRCPRSMCTRSRGRSD